MGLVFTFSAMLCSSVDTQIASVYGTTFHSCQVDFFGPCTQVQGQGSDDHRDTVHIIRCKRAGGWTDTHTVKERARTPTTTTSKVWPLVHCRLCDTLESSSVVLASLVVGEVEVEAQRPHSALQAEASPRVDVSEVSCNSGRKAVRSFKAQNH